MGFFALVKIAQKGELDAIIVNAVRHKLIDVLRGQRAKKRGAQYEHLVIDEKYDDRDDDTHPK